jgi:hypothetical protein
MTVQQPRNDYWPLVAIAAVDVLGIRALVAKKDKSESAAMALGLLEPHPISWTPYSL